MRWDDEFQVQGSTAPLNPPEGGKNCNEGVVQGSRGVDWLEFALQMAILCEMIRLIGVSVSKISDLSLFSFIIHAIS